MPSPIYLDFNATTPVAAPVLEAMLPFWRTAFGNPSSAHSLGRQAAHAVAHARAQVAAAIGAAADEVLFTGSATEANNLALLGASQDVPPERRHLIVSAVEHPAVMGPAQELQRLGWRLSVAPVDTEGRVDVQAIAALLQEPTALVSVMHANNELGTVQPVEEIGRLCRQHRALFHVDAAQSLGKIPVSVDDIGADLLTMAGHKIYAPKGIGALYVRRGTSLKPLYFGASQERGLRSGTENVAYIVGLGAAAEYVTSVGPTKWAPMAKLRDALQAQLEQNIPGLVVNGSLTHRLPNTLHVSIPHGSAQEIVSALADQVALSVGAACHSEAGAASSGVMATIGADAQRARGALRISLGYDTTEQDATAAARMLTAAIGGPR